ncbi:hypothetical protein EGW08_021051 [Elysia chlorotica]|uniref:Citrate transporter-like domain-containing protein n=1 Tax=Elysia chlorotica TaxID=188477 RepID=A0A3S1ASV5_ELYCH|nr:hypothetical protein EGW08_021051 [Elysia chlorotica]
MGVLADIWKMRTLWLVPAFFLGAIPILTEIDESEMSQESRRCLYVLVVMALTWITESLPISATALFPMVLFPLMGIMTAKATSAAYLTDTSMLFIGGLMVAVAVEEWDLHKRIALGVMRLVGSDPKWVMAGLMLPSWFLSMWISNTATASMMLPIAAAVLAQVKAVKTGKNLHQISRPGDLDADLDLEQHQGQPAEVKDAPDLARLTKGLTLCIAYAANIGGVSTLTGTPPNLVLKQNADEGCCTLDRNQAHAIKKTIKDEWNKLGPVTLAQVILMVLFVFLAVMWVSRDPNESPGWGVWFEQSFASDSTAAMLIAVSLFILPAKLPNICCFKTPERAKEPVYTPILVWEQVHRKLPWGVIILLGGGFALAKGVQVVSELSNWLADKLETLDYLDKWVLNLSLCLIVAAFTEVTSNTATASLLMPIMANLGKSLGYNPLYLMVSTALATSFAFMLPVATPPNAIVFSYGAIKVTDMAFAGFFMNLIAVAVLTLAVNTWGVEIYDFDTFDPIFNKTLTP